MLARLASTASTLAFSCNANGVHSHRFECSERKIENSSPKETNQPVVNDAVAKVDQEQVAEAM